MSKMAAIAFEAFLIYVFGPCIQLHSLQSPDITDSQNMLSCLDDVEILILYQSYLHEQEFSWLHIGM